jgi:hypothetical protein
MRIFNVPDENAKGFKSTAVRELPKPAGCRAKRARWPGVVHCLADGPTGCQHTRYFNNAAYCTHPEREAIMARTRAENEARPGASKSSRHH